MPRGRASTGLSQDARRTSFSGAPATHGLVVTSLREGILSRDPSSEATLSAQLLPAASEPPSDAMIWALLHNWRRDTVVVDATERLVELAYESADVEGRSVADVLLDGAVRADRQHPAREGLARLLSDERTRELTRAALGARSGDSFYAELSTELVGG